VFVVVVVVVAFGGSLEYLELKGWGSLAGARYGWLRMDGYAACFRVDQHIKDEFAIISVGAQ